MTAIVFDRIVLPKFTRAADALGTYADTITEEEFWRCIAGESVAGLREIISKNAIKDMMVEEDAKILGALAGAA